jgi:hypothetical protein
MTKREIKDMENANASAFNALQHVIRATEGNATPQPAERVKNPAAVALGLLGASKGGKARAKALSKTKRRQIAEKAATARWGNRH